jgi:hypothetical protein
MAKKTSVKVRLVPELKPDSAFNYYVKRNFRHTANNSYLTIFFSNFIEY